MLTASPSASAAAIAAMYSCKQQLVQTLKAELIGLPLSNIPTPFLVIDLDTVELNAARMKNYLANVNKSATEASAVRLRPHAKMHKSVALSQLQMKIGGAVGMCCQKVSEAEVLLLGGINDVLITNEVSGAAKLAHLAHLAVRVASDPSAKLAVCVDSVSGAASLTAALLEASAGSPPPRRLPVLIEVNVGQNRGGCEPSTSAMLPVLEYLVNEASAVIEFAGLHAYHGGAQHIRSVIERRSAMEASHALARLAKSIALPYFTPSEAHPVMTVTGGGTGTFFLEACSGIYTEVQPGSYLVMDRDYGENETAVHCDALPAFEHALYVQTSVVSDIGIGNDRRIVFDFGHKTAAIDCGGPALAPFLFPSQLLSSTKPPWCVGGNGGDDHTVLTVSESNRAVLPSAVAGWLPGDVTWFVPGHCDPTFNLHDFVVAVRGLAHPDVVCRKSVRVVDVLSVDCRGLQQ